MKITEITFSKKYSYLPYHPLTPGFVATLEEGEDPLDAMKKLDDLSKQYYETHYGQPTHLYQEQTQYPYQMKNGDWVYEKTIGGMPTGGIIVTDIPPKSEEKITPELSEYDQMKLCTTQEQLDKEWKIISGSNATIKTFYDLRTIELKNK